jgi:hypothetical protein
LPCAKNGRKKNACPKNGTSVFLTLLLIKSFIYTFVNILVWSGLVWSGLVWSGLVWSGLVWSGLVWSGLVWSGLVWSLLLIFCILLFFYEKFKTGLAKGFNTGVSMLPFRYSPSIPIL